jgi:hypothetical protein
LERSGPRKAVAVGSGLTILLAEPPDGIRGYCLPELIAFVTLDH